VLAFSGFGLRAKVLDWRGLLVAGTVAALANVAGGWLLVSANERRRDERLLKYLVALGAGFMLAAIFVEVVPESFRLWYAGAGEMPVEPMALLLGGYLLIQFFEHTLAPHFHFGEETHSEALLRPSAAYTAIGGLMVHTFFDGVSIGAAFQLDFRVGLLIFIAILLHKLPEGFTGASIMLASGRSARAARWATLAIGAATFVGVFSVTLLQAAFPRIVAYALPFSAGVTLYVAASDLIPEVNHKEERNPVVSIIVFVGVAFFYALHWLFEGR
jgi:zinc transporter ZupT